MRILDQESDASLNQITLYLTVSEAQELKDSLEMLLTSSAAHHEHVSSSDFKKELTLTIYDSQSIGSYDDRSQQIIREDR